MEKRMVRFTMIVTRDIEEASEFNMQCDIQDPFAFIDAKDTKIEMKYEILPENLKHRI